MKNLKVLIVMFLTDICGMSAYFGVVDKCRPLAVFLAMAVLFGGLTLMMNICAED